MIRTDSSGAQRTLPPPDPGHPAGGGSPGRPGRDEPDRGSVTLMVAVLFAALVALAGIVVDGGAKLTGDENAAAVAQEAARAGATSVDSGSAYGSGAFAVDGAQAQAAARAYLSGAGYTNFAVGARGPDAMSVRVTITRPTTFLSIIGIDTFTCTGTAVASLVTSGAGTAAS